MMEEREGSSDIREKAERQRVRLDFPVFITVDELSELLKISTILTYKFVENKEIPFYRIGKTVRFRADEILQWLSERKNVGFSIECIRMGRKRGRKPKEKSDSLIHGELPRIED